LHRFPVLRFVSSDCSTDSFNMPFFSDKISEDAALFDGLSEIIDDTIIEQTRTRIAVGRQETQVRIRPHLENMSAFLDGFEEDAALAN
jgi:hypothetical protein